MTDDERYPLGKPHRPGTPVEQPEWLRKIKARNSDTGRPAGVDVDEHGRWRTVNHTPHTTPNACTCQSPSTIMGVCVICGKVVAP